MRRVALITAALAVTLGAAPLAFADTVEAVRVLQRGTIIGPGDVMVSYGEPRRNEAQAMHEVIGKEVRATVRPGRAIRTTDLRSPILVERNQLVDLVYRSGTLTIRGEGRALRQGGSGERIRVMNLDSRIVITGQVTSDGRVEVRP
jgi:flagella basal body P-ring formation protein FlgA